MRFSLLFLVLGLGLLWAEEPDPSWKRASPDTKIQLPQDEYAHPDYKTEWWYFTGNLQAVESDRRFGYQLTFFRIGVRPPAERATAESRFVVDHFWFAHLAISDPDRKRFEVADAFSRGAFAEAGSEPLEGDTRVAWLKDWEMHKTQEEAGHYHLIAAREDFGIDLRLDTAKPRVLQGQEGFSPKSGNPANASHYYSFTRLLTEGTLTIGGEAFEVEGQSWYDREWSTSLLDREQVGWDWFSLQFEDQSELMLFQLRKEDGSTDYASGTLVQPDGATRTLGPKDIQLKAGKIWKRASTEASYPVRWDVVLPGLDTRLEVRAAQLDQELDLNPISYWEGAVDVQGTKKGEAAKGVGYLEMTGYSGSIQER